MKFRVTAFDGFPEAEFMFAYDVHDFVKASTTNGFVEIMRRGNYRRFMDRRIVRKMSRQEFYIRAHANDISNILMSSAGVFGYSGTFGRL